MKKTILILAAIFIANNIFSQDLDSLLNETINSVNKVLVDNGEESLINDTDAFKKAAQNDLMLWENDKNYNVNLIELSKQYGVVIPYIDFVSGTNKDELVTKIVKIIKQKHPNYSSDKLHFGFAIATDEYNYYFYVNIVIGYPGDIRKTCYYKK